MSRVVFDFELLKNVKIIHVQNEYVHNFTEIFFFTIFGWFLITLQKTTEKIEKRVKQSIN